MSEQTSLQTPSTKTNGQEILRIEGLTKLFGGLKAVNNFSLSLNKGDLNGLIGPNGAGKTTVFNMITGVLCAHSRVNPFQRAGNCRA